MKQETSRIWAGLCRCISGTDIYLSHSAALASREIIKKAADDCHLPSLGSSEVWLLVPGDELSPSLAC